MIKTPLFIDTGQILSLRVRGNVERMKHWISEVTEYYEQWFIMKSSKLTAKRVKRPESKYIRYAIVDVL